MAGASFEHNAITLNLGGELRARLKGTPCVALTQDMRVRISFYKYYYPDVVIVSGKPEFLDSDVDTLLNPTVVFEILSPSTERRDKNKKLPAYRAVETLQEIVYVSQESPQIEVFRRVGEKWLVDDVMGIEATLVLNSVSCEIPLAEIYDRIDFTQPQNTRSQKKKKS